MFGTNGQNQCRDRNERNARIETNVPVKRFAPKRRTSARKPIDDDRQYQIWPHKWKLKPPWNVQISNGRRVDWPVVPYGSPAWAFDLIWEPRVHPLRRFRMELPSAYGFWKLFHFECTSSDSFRFWKQNQWRTIKNKLDSLYPIRRWPRFALSKKILNVL